MKQFMQHTWFRVLVSGAFATAAIFIVVGSAVRHYQPANENPALDNLQSVKVVSLRENPALAEAIRKEREKHDGVQQRQPPPPPVTPDREVSGFVQLEYTINPDGTVSDVRVVGAAPSGVYEERAIAEARRSMHAPGYNDDGEPIARRTTEIIEFSVPASEVLESK